MLIQCDTVHGNAMRKIPLLFGGVASGRGGLCEKLTAEIASLRTADKPSRADRRTAVSQFDNIETKDTRSHRKIRIHATIYFV